MNNIIKITKITITLSILSFLTGCFSSNDDLKKWVKTQEKNLRGKIEPLPRNIDYTFVAFAGVPTIDPFKSKEIKTIVEATESKQMFSPETNRRKEPLESYPLADLQLTGFLEEGGQKYAIIKASDGKVFSALKGNYVGNNFGKIVSIDDNKLILRELLQVNDEWTENMTDLTMKD